MKVEKKKEKRLKGFSEKLRDDNLSCQPECSNYHLKVSGHFFLSYSNNSNSKFTSVLFSHTFLFLKGYGLVFTN